MRALWSPASGGSQTGGISGAEPLREGRCGVQHLAVADNSGIFSAEPPSKGTVSASVLSRTRCSACLKAVAQLREEGICISYVWLLTLSYLLWP